MRGNFRKKRTPPEGRRGRRRAFGGSDVREMLPEDKKDARPEAGGGEALFQRKFPGGAQHEKEKKDAHGEKTVKQRRCQHV